MCVFDDQLVDFCEPPPFNDRIPLTEQKIFDVPLGMMLKNVRHLLFCHNVCLRWSCAFLALCSSERTFAHKKHFLYITKQKQFLSN